MYIEFRLPGGAGGMAAGYTKQAINKHLKAIADSGRITIVEQVHQPYRFRVELASEQEYTILALIWPRKNEWFCYKLYNEPITTKYDPDRYVIKKGS